LRWRRGERLPKDNIKWLLLTIKYLKDIKGRTKLQKIIYLLKEKFNLDIAYNFMPYYYGPYSSELQNDVDVLSRLNLIDVNLHFLDNGVFLYEHQLTERGYKIAEELERSLQPDQVKKLKEALDKLKEYNTDELIKIAKENMKQKLSKNKDRFLFLLES